MTSDMETKDKISGPPPPKRLKQATLSFKVLTPKPVVPQVNQSPTGKKRKLSESSQQNSKAPKAAKNEDIKKKTHRHEDEENEVSSSSEAETLAKVADIVTEKPKSSGLIDRFVKIVPTQQEEVSTSCEDGMLVDHTDDADVSVTSEDVQNQEDVVDKETKDNIVKKLCVKPKLVVQSPDEEIVEEKECGDVQKSKDKLCVIPVEVTDETPKKRTRQSSTNLKVTPSTKTNDEISASGEKRKITTPVSEKKEEERKKKAEEKEKQRLEKLEQKQKEKEDKEKKRIEEKERKEKEKLEAKVKKEEERKEKEKQKEKEREEKLKQKEEEKKKKQEIIDAKNEEKKKKEEEKKKKDEEKKQQEEEKKKEEDEKKQMALEKKKKFQSFFTKSSKTSPPPKPQQSRGPFMPLEPKKDQKLAPTCRVVLDDQRKTLLTSEMERQGDTKTYIVELKDGKRVPGHSTKTWPWSQQCDIDDDVICTDSVPDKTEKKKKQYLMKAKLMQFSENHRPAFYGTWRKKSKKLCARNPLAKDEEIFDYSVDSDDEWEEEEPGESVSDSEGEVEDDKPEEEEEEEDEFIVPHGYLSEGEGAEEEEDETNPDKMKARQVAKARAWEMEMKNSKTEVLKMLAIGCNWWQPNEKVSDFHTETLDLFKVVPLVASLPISTKSKSTSPSAGGQSAKQKKLKEAKRKSLVIPEEALPDIIRLVHGNMYSFQKFYKEFKEFWRLKHLDQGKLSENTEKQEADSQQDTEKQEKNSIQSPAPTKSSPDAQSCDTESNMSGISKRAFELKIREIAIFEKRDNFKKSRWFVNQDVLEKYNLTDLPVPNEWNWLTRSTKDSAKKNETPEGSKVDNQEKKSGRTTPSIAQFAKPGVTPSLHSVTPSSGLSMKSPTSNSGFITPQQTVETPKRVEKTITPSVLFKHKKKTVKPIEKTPTCMDVTDCIIIEGDSPSLKPLPKVAEKGQRTLLNMLSKKSKPAEKVVPVPIEIDLT